MKHKETACKSKHLLLALALFIICSAYHQVQAQAKRSKVYDEYVLTYSDLAVRHMKDYKIPASITLGQGLLESGAGQSGLALKSNNHFGIKCHNDWTGPTVIAKDDRPDDCFRKYGKVADSYTDHSRFLTEKKRYAFLFELDITDYTGWAKGLQKAGYATDKAYANKLIKLIEDYELYRYDKPSSQKTKKASTKTSSSTSAISKYRHTPYKTYGLVYVIAEKGDSYESISEEFGFKAKDICEYNEVPEDFPLQPGNVVYFQKKKKKADNPHYEHVVKVGESMHSISQFYGIRVKNLYKMNKQDFEYVPIEGDVLRLR